MSNNEWLSLPAAVELFGPAVMGLLGRVRTLPGPKELLFRHDLEELLAVSAGALLDGEVLPYGELARLFGIKRGWLDRLVKEKRLAPPTPDGEYHVGRVLALLTENPTQENDPVPGYRPPRKRK